jgi:ferritin-like metal-binding protein YciE
MLGTVLDYPHHFPAPRLQWPFRGLWLRHAALIACGANCRALQISRYGTLIAWAIQLERPDCAELFQQNLEEEKATDKALTALALQRVNRKAA